MRLTWVPESIQYNMLQRTIRLPRYHASSSPDPLRRNSMFTIPEQFSNATKTHFEAQLAMMTALTNKAFESVEKIVDLNMSAVKASLEESTAAARQILTAKDPQEFFSLTAAQNQIG